MGVWVLVKEGGWGAMLALGLGVLGLFVGVSALVLLAVSGRAAFTAALVAVAVAVLASTVGVLGMMSGRHMTEAAVDGGVVSAVTADRIRKEGYRESQGAAKVGFAASLVPLVAGAVAALLGARARRAAPAIEPGPSGPWAPQPRARSSGRTATAAIAAVLGLLASGSALAAGLGPLPKGKYDFDVLDRDAWALAEARELVETNLTDGCDDLDTALRAAWQPTTPTAWPRSFHRNPDALVPDWRPTATRCARAIWDEVRPRGTVTHPGRGSASFTLRPSRTWDAKALLESPLLIDETLHTELLAAQKAPAFDGFGGAIDDSFGAPATVTMRFGAPTVVGRLPPEVVARIVRQNIGAFRLCYAASKTPGLVGTVRARVTIDRTGSVTGAADSGSDLSDVGVRQCVLDKLGRLTFPEPEGGTVVATVPITFAPSR